MRTLEELNALKNEVEALNEKLSTLTEDVMMQVIGGIGDSHCGIYIGDGQMVHSPQHA